jgi:hypothetical protein
LSGYAAFGKIFSIRGPGDNEMNGPEAQIKKSVFSEFLTLKVVFIVTGGMLLIA